MNGVGPSANATAKVGRNNPCPCGSGRKYKHCCQAKDASAEFAAGTAHGSPRSPAVRHRVQSLFLAATRHWEAGRATEAISLFGEITRLDPNSPQAHHDLGLAFLRSGWLIEATASLRRALELQPSLDSALGHLSTALLQQGREREAAARLSQAWPQGRGSGRTAVLFRPGAGDGGQNGGSGEGASPSARPGA